MATPVPAGRETPPGRNPVDTAREICLRQLETRARSRAELAAKLRSKGVADEVAETALDRLAAVGLIDDDAFAAAVISSARDNRGLARRGLAAELRRRGVDEEVASSALGDLDAAAEESVARDLVSRRLRSMNGLERQVQLRRLVAMLGRKGYPTDLAVRVVTEALGPAGEPEYDEPASVDS